MTTTLSVTAEETLPAEPEEDEEGMEEEEPTEEPSEPSEPPQGQPEPLSEKQLNEALSKLEKEAARHRSRLTEIMGEEALLLVPCALCEQHMAGWRFPIQPDEDDWREVTAAVYGVEVHKYNSAGWVQQCSACDGLGQIATNSKVPGRETISCRACGGFGYVTQDTPPLTVVPPPTPQETQPSFGPPVEPPAEVDFMGRTRDDPNFGVLAGYER